MVNYTSNDVSLQSFRVFADCGQCDEGKPSCMQCQKVKRVCPGYRDAFDLNLRDETKSTKRYENFSLQRAVDAHIVENI